MKLFTIGFTKKSAEEFFNILINNKIQKVIDIRLNNKSQLAGFAKYPDIKYFLNTIGKIDYIHRKEYAPSEDILSNYKKKNMTWKEYEEKYIKLLSDRNIINNINEDMSDNTCLSIDKARKCKN